ncbi:glycogen synthase [Shewanella colwelliana]|uniref:glycogen synthase n=1 Tax=Shewanella colwelliana TaxID=23 RepID=UPI0037360BD2
MKRVLMLAAENGALNGAKVGGMADVIRDLPHALYPYGVCADIAMPSYGFLHRELTVSQQTMVKVSFYGQPHWVTLYQCVHPQLPEVNLYLFDHPLFDDGGNVYTLGQSDRPFADDANKFALFCASVATALAQQTIALPDHLHLHDWHCGVMALLRAYSPEHQILQRIPSTITIHNLAIQGTRPLNNEHSSLQSWFPQLYRHLSDEAINHICDRRYLNCFNPLRAAIVLSDKVHLVSPNYAKEVLQPSDAQRGFYGGEGLEEDLQVKQQHQQLLGILNGCQYERASPSSRKLSARKALEQGGLDTMALLLSQAENALQRWMVNHPYLRSVDQIALVTIARLNRALGDSIEPRTILTSVGRLTDQKVKILLHQDDKGISTLAHLLARLEQCSPRGVLVLLGSGDSEIEQALAKLASCNHNFLFLNGFDLSLSQALYDEGSLFIMPSSFEPCGISQMLAMRAGQPCLVHGVGGLLDTVNDEENGFVFFGDSIAEQASEMLRRFDALLPKMATAEWQAICDNAKAKRFDWSRSAKAYCEQLYQFAT